MSAFEGKADKGLVDFCQIYFPAPVLAVNRHWVEA
jgi:hypothetical protein